MPSAKETVVAWRRIAEAIAPSSSRSSGPWCAKKGLVLKARSKAAVLGRPWMKAGDSSGLQAVSNGAALMPDLLAA